MTVLDYFALFDKTQYFILLLRLWTNKQNVQQQKYVFSGYGENITYMNYSSVVLTMFHLLPFDPHESLVKNYCSDLFILNYYGPRAHSGSFLCDAKLCDI